MTRSATVGTGSSKQARKAAGGVEKVSRMRHASASREKQGSSTDALVCGEDGDGSRLGGPGGEDGGAGQEPVNLA